jgi:hypothetical protein
MVNLTVGCGECDDGGSGSGGDAGKGGDKGRKD